MEMYLRYYTAFWLAIILQSTKDLFHLLSSIHCKSLGSVIALLDESDGRGNWTIREMCVSSDLDEAQGQSMQSLLGISEWYSLCK
jgi:hypothetical protein